MIATNAPLNHTHSNVVVPEKLIYVIDKKLLEDLEQLKDNYPESAADINKFLQELKNPAVDTKMKDNIKDLLQFLVDHPSIHSDGIRLLNLIGKADANAEHNLTSSEITESVVLMGKLQHEGLGDVLVKIIDTFFNSNDIGDAYKEMRDAANKLDHDVAAHQKADSPVKNLDLLGDYQALNEATQKFKAAIIKVIMVVPTFQSDASYYSASFAKIANLVLLLAMLGMDLESMAAKKLLAQTDVASVISKYRELMQQLSGLSPFTKKDGTVEWDLAKILKLKCTPLIDDKTKPNPDYDANFVNGNLHPYIQDEFLTLESLQSGSMATLSLQLNAQVDKINLSLRTYPNTTPILAFPSEVWKEGDGTKISKIFGDIDKRCSDVKSNFDSLQNNLKIDQDAATKKMGDLVEIYRVFCTVTYEKIISKP